MTSNEEEPSTNAGEMAAASKSTRTCRFALDSASSRIHAADDEKGQDDIEQGPGLDAVEQQEAEEGGGDAASPPLHGLEKEMSMAHLDHAANFTDYMKAQRSLSQSLRHSSARMSHTAAADGCTAGGAPTRSDQAECGGRGNQQSPQTPGGIHGRTSSSAVSVPVSPSAQPTRTEEEHKTIHRLGLIGRRSSMANAMATNGASAGADTVAWDNIFSELAAIDEDGHFHDGNEHVIPWYSPPVQRQRWGQDQILPHVNWGDLFFDLFYVAAAYNLGVMLTSAMNRQDWPRGLIYFVGIFGPMWTTWDTSVHYESRYTKVDYAHRLFEVVRFLFVSLAVLHIKPIGLLADPKSTETFTFTLAIVLESLMHLGLNCELYVKGQGDRAAIRNHTAVKIKYQLVPTLIVYVAALVVAAVQYAQPTDSYNHNRLLAAAEPDVYGSEYEQYEQTNEPRWVLSDLPLTLTAIAYLLNIVHTTWRKMRATSGKHGDIRQRFVPNNVEYIVHRYGEWVLLMIGEGILSLLIVETTESSDYYIITTFGVLTVIFIQILKFESEPSNAESHAMWCNMRNAMSYGYLIQILSMSLISFGVCYKVMLKDVLKTDEQEKGSEYGYDDGKNPNRMLAPSVEVSDEATAALFTGSLSVVLISLELMILTHGGIKKALSQFFHQAKGEQNGEDTERKPYWSMIRVAVYKMGIFVFTFTLNQWTVDPAVLTLCGFGIVASLALTRVLSWAFIHHKKVIDNATKSVVSTVRNFTQSVSFAPAPSISATGEKALATTCNQSTGSIDADKRSDSGSTSTKGTDLVSGGINSSFDAIIVSDLNGIITQVNVTAVDTFGYSTKSEMIGKNLAIIVGGGEGKRHDAYMGAFTKRIGSKGSKHSKILGQQRMLQGRRGDGTEFPCIIGIKLCANDTRIVGYIRDMSGVVSEEKSKLSTNMNDVEEAIERVVDDHAFDAIIATDSRGTIQRVNETAVKEFGYDSKGDLVGENISTLIHGVIGHPELLLDSHGEQRVVTITRHDGVEFQSIIATTKIKGTDNMVASYIRNVDPVKHKFTCEKCD